MSEPVQERRCWRGPRCQGAYRDVDELVGAPADRPLCDLCETAVRQTLTAVPKLYLDLRNATLIREVGAKNTDYITQSKGSPMPLNARALDLTEQITWLLTTWEEIVRDIAGLTPAVHEGKREGRRVTDAARLLEAYLTAWTGAPHVVLSTSRWTADTEQSGAAAAAALLDWKRAARVALGEPAQKPAARCWVPARNGTCGGPVWAGTGAAHCTTCGTTWTGADFIRIGLALDRKAIT